MKIKSKFCAFLALALTTFTPLLGQEAAEEAPEWLNRFKNLAPTEQKEYEEHFVEAARLFGQKRIFEALNSLTKAEQIYKDYPSALNLKGACYVEFRDFKAARENFLKAAALAPKSSDIIFNLAEVDFVTQEWERCEEYLDKALDLTPKEKIQMIRLIEYKLLLTKIRLKKEDEVKALSVKYGFDDDSPYHYYSKAALAYEKEDPEKAEEWLRICRRIFKKPEMLAPWQDTIIEFGYVRSFYGGDLEEDATPAP